MYLLNPSRAKYGNRKVVDLHSTMYLLNPDDVTLFVFDEVFTFHYVSIKSQRL